MNKKMIKLTAALMAASAAALSAGAFTVFADEDVYLTEINFPDKTFRDYVQENFDADNNSILTQDEIEKAKAINVRGMEINSLRGVEFLTSLTTLNCSQNSLTSLYLRENTALTTLDCSENSLASLDVRSNSALTSLNCSENSLASLDVSNNTELKELICSNNKQLASINVSGCSKLTKLWCSDNSLTALDLSGCTAVNSLDFNRNSLTSLDISGCTGIEYIYFESNQLQSLDVSNNPLLKIIDLTNNCFTSIDISGCNSLMDLRGSGQTYSIGAVEGSYPLESLPKGFDPARAADWTNAQYDGITNSLKSFTSTSVSYTYKCDDNDKFSLNVTLIADSYTDPDAGSVEINDTNFPDEAFRTYVEKFDSNSNGKLSPEEIAAADEIYVSSENITSLKGIEYFTATRSLYCNNTSLTELDVSKNTALETISCSGNQLTALDISHNAALKNLDCQYNSIASLDLSHNPALTELNCINNSLTSLDLSGCPKLNSLACDNNNITELDLSKNTALTMLVCESNGLTRLDISGCNAIKLIRCNKNSLTSLDVSGCTGLVTFECDSQSYSLGDVSGIYDLSGLPQGFDPAKASEWTGASYDSDANILKSFTLESVTYNYDCGSGNTMNVTLTLNYQSTIADVDINETNFPDDTFRTYVLDVADINPKDTKLSELEINAVTDMYLYGKGISDLKGIEHFTALELLRCDSNQLESLDVSKNTRLTKLHCDYNKLTSLDVSGCTALKTLWCHYNQLTGLDVSGCTALTELDCSNNQLTALDISKNTALRVLLCEDNQITGLDVRNNTELATLRCPGNQLTSLDVSKNTALAVFTCYDNRLTSLDVSGNTVIYFLHCYNNQLTSLNVSGCTALERLYCENNQLTSLDVSGFTSLDKLTCNDNQLESLNVSGCTALKELTCGTNRLTSLDVTDCTALTALDTGIQSYDIGDVSGSYDLSRLPKGFDPARASSWSGASYDSSANALKKFYAKAVNYIYDCGNGNSMGVDLTLSYQSPVGDVVINEESFPDEAFRTYILDNIDIDPKDGKLSELEMNRVFEIDVTQKGITDLKGIEYFTAIKMLYCSDNQLTSLDLSGFTALTELRCTDNLLTSLNVSGCTALESLHCEKNQLTSLNVNGCTALESLYCEKNQLTSLNVNGCTALEVLVCSENQLTSLDAGGCTALTRLDCSINSLESLDISGCTALEALYCYENKLTSLDVSGFTSLESFACNKNCLASLDVTGCTALTDLICANQTRSIGAVDGSYPISRFPAGFDPKRVTNLIGAEYDPASDSFINFTSKTLTYTYDCGQDYKMNVTLNADSYRNIDEAYINEENFPDKIFRAYVSEKFDSDRDGKLSKAEMDAVKLINVANQDISDLKGIELFTSLEALYCGSNPFTSLDLSRNTKLNDLQCSDNKLTSLDLSGNTAITKLSCYDSSLERLDVSGCSALKTLDCYQSKLTSLDLSGCTALTKLRCNVNQLTSLDVSSCTALTDLNCSANSLTSLDVSGCTALCDLDCYTNKLTSLDVSRNTALIALLCYNNELTSLNIGVNTSVKSLNCRGNSLTSLDISGCTALTSLYCYDNELTSLDVSSNTALKTLKCYNNRLTSLDLSRNADITDTDLSGNSFYIGEVTSSYDLRNLPGSFDSSRASDWQGAVCGNGILRKITSDTITYTYDCGRGIRETFTLTTAMNSEAPVPAFVDRLYTTLLGRTADETGKADWVNEINGGRPAADVASGFVLSEELANQNLSNGEFIDRMYRTLLDREADEAGKAEWVSALDKGCSYGYILSSFAGSQEFINLCADYGITAGAYVTSEPRDVNLDLTAFVSRMYTKALGRAYDAVGLNDWTNDYLNGAANAEKIAYGFIFSPEFVNRELSNEQYVDTLYRTFFDREADPAGRADWISALEDGTSREDVLNGFLGSQEFENLKAGFNV